MTGADRSNRHHLRLIPVESFPVPEVARPPSPTTLAARIVAAAQAWAAEVLASPLVLDPESREGRARLALLDAVHDLEYHSVYPPTAPYLPLEFERDEPGTP